MQIFKMIGFLMFLWSFCSTVRKLLSHNTFGQHRTVDALWSGFGKYVSIIMSRNNVMLSRIRTKVSEWHVGICLLVSVQAWTAGCWQHRETSQRETQRQGYVSMCKDHGVLNCFDKLNSSALALSCEHMKQFTLLPEVCSIWRHSGIHATLYRRRKVSYRPEPWTYEPYLYGKRSSEAQCDTEAYAK